MIVVDTSALTAIYRDEAEARRFARLIEDDGDARVAAPNFFEFMMVAVGRRGSEEAADASLLVSKLELEIAAWDERMATQAIEAFVRFGKGRHPASLNFGDCMAYALARSLDAPLLFKGTDFATTDVRIADPSLRRDGDDK